MPLRKRPGSAVPDGFAPFAARVEAANRALLAAIPTARDPGVPLPDALEDFGRALDEAAAALQGWRGDPVMHEWTKCSDALEAARSESGRLRAERDLGFEALNARVGDVLVHLETVADVERALRRRR